ncbi:PTS sugar transporter subunit IIA [Halobacillus litoralis]|uniref:PTS sugar transporter subunit IIA n=1 Tax=Halobacillus litoralis TaxID=45668 RepID=UPI001CD4907A|nr:hypothetical protein [Halobacillus litoralis]MCA1020539.1 hypothetical protein [Halobacillus litoralis]
MLSIVIATHGQLSYGLKNSFEMIIGESQHVYPVSLEEGIDSFTSSTEKLIEDLLKEYEGILVLTDLKGGTPYNVSLKQSFIHEDKVKVIAGVNLPMVIETSLILESSDLPSLTQKAVEFGQEAITD